MKSLKSKFITAITGLIILVIFTTSAILVNQKRLEIQEDIYFNARSFSELATPSIINLVNANLKSENFLFFVRDLNSILKNNSDIASVQIYTFSGQLLFDSETEVQRRYQGPTRVLDPNSSLLPRIKSANPSLLNQSNQLYYLSKISPGFYEVLTEEGFRSSHLANQKNFRQLQNIVFPFNGEFAVKYNLTYESISNRLFSSALQILIIAILSIMASAIIGYILSVIVTNPIRKLTTIVEQIAKGNFQIRANIKSEDEVGTLADSVNHMAEDLEQSTEARIYQEKTKKELEIAAKIQRDLLPSILPEIPGIQISAQVIPASEVGGDVYDVLLDKNNIPYFYVGDVTGHGVPAGLISSVTNAIITSTLNLADPLQIVANLNHTLKQKSAGNLFITLLFARYLNNSIQYISAGHEKSIHHSAQSQLTTFLNPGGIALGLFEEVSDKLKLETLNLNSGDFFITYTDGIPEAWKSETEQLGDQEFLKIVDTAISNNQTAEQVKQAVLSAVKQYMGDYPQKDDITIIVIKKL